MMSRGIEKLERADFTRTHWNTVLLSAQNTAEGAQALEMLCRTYWPSVYAFVRRKGFAPSDAEDMTQQFFLRLIERRSMASADPSKGRFRSFLLGALQHFLADEWDKSRAAKRGGGLAWISFDDRLENVREPMDTDMAPEQVFARRWAWALINSALEKLATEYAAAGKASFFERLKPLLTEEIHSEGYGRLSIELGLSPNTVAKTVQRLRQRFRLLVRSGAAQTVTNPADLEDELRQLFTP